MSHFPSLLVTFWRISLARRAMSEGASGNGIISGALARNARIKILSAYNLSENLAAADRPAARRLCPTGEIVAEMAHKLFIARHFEKSLQASCANSSIIAHMKCHLPSAEQARRRRRQAILV